MFRTKELYLKNQVQVKMANTRKKCAPTPIFVSRNQLVLKGLESPFAKELNPENRWIVLANLIPWDEILHITDFRLQSRSFGSRRQIADCS